MTTSLPPDPWKALGIERDADKSEIRTAYKKLVLRCHPDKVQDPTLKALKADEFQKVQQAWELLNDDAEKAKYEQKLRLAELQRAAKVQQDVKISPNTSVPRTSTKYATYDIRTAEPPSRYKSSPSGGKVYTHYTTQTRSHEEMPSSRVYPLYDEADRQTDRQARRAASYEKPAKRDDEKRDRERDDRRRRREEDEHRLREKARDRERDRDREREREKAEKEREARKAEKKRVEKEREKERRREAEEKRRPAYVENYADALLQQDEEYVTSRSEKKRSSSRKHDETRERDSGRNRDREKSSSRRAKSPPHVAADRKHIDRFEEATSYLKSQGSSIRRETFWGAQPSIETTPIATTDRAPHAPTPPPIDFDDESIRHAASRAAGRRASNDPARSREKLMPDGTPTKARPIALPKSYSSISPTAPESPPSRLSRSQTTPHEPYGPYRANSPPPSLLRTQTWTPSSNSAGDYWADGLELEDDRDRRRHRSRRTRSPSAQATHRYKVDGVKTSKLEPQYSYSESPTSSRRYAADPIDGPMSRSPSSAYYSGYKVKQAKSYGPSDVQYADFKDPVYYSSNHVEGYPVQA